MPIYDYQCQDCKKPYEVFYSTFSAVKKDEGKEKCPHCQSIKKQKLISKGTTHIFKSGSWFKGGY